LSLILTLTTSAGSNTVGVFLFLTHRLEYSVSIGYRTVNGSVGTLILTHDTVFERFSRTVGRCVWRHGCCVSDH